MGLVRSDVSSTGRGGRPKGLCTAWGSVRRSEPTLHPVLCLKDALGAPDRALAPSEPDISQPFFLSNPAVGE